MKDTVLGMAQRWFMFVQFEFPWELGPEDGRYLLRRSASVDEAEGEPEHVVVLRTLNAARPSWIMPRSGRKRQVKLVDPQVEATPVPVARATVIDPQALGDEREAQAWLARGDDELQAQAAIKVLNGVLWAHSIATADPYAREAAATQALVIRAGWGSGDQVAAGHWEQARELSWKARRDRKHSAALRPQERLAALLSGREAALLCEEPTLRARRDLEAGRLLHAGLELEQAYALAVEELGREDREDLATRLAELRELRGSFAGENPDEQAIRHALGRLEAALRARTAAGVAGVREGS
jgi:hypothetical protein